MNNSPDSESAIKASRIQDALIGQAAYEKGDILGYRYRVHSVLGSGGFGVVYLVHPLTDGGIHGLDDDRVPALKTYRDEFLFDANVRRQFRKEALIWVKLGFYPFIVQAYGVHEFDGRLFVAMECVPPNEDGLVSLQDHIAFHGRNISDRMIGTWTVEFCHGMEYANSKGVTAHRDIKPTNILIGAGAFIKIADFGLAASLDGCRLPPHIDSTRSCGLTIFDVSGKQTCGTPGYIAPEVYRGEEADVRSDIYSFGAVLWQLCAASTAPPFAVPFRGDIPSYLNEIYRLQIQAHVPIVNSAFWDVIRKCLEPNPNQRYSSFSDLRESIKEAVERAGGTKLDFIVNTAESFASLVSRGASFRALCQFEDALDCLERAARIEPGHPGVWLNMANALSSLNRDLEALNAYDKALKLDPNFEPAWLNKGIFLQNREEHALAVQCFDKLLQINGRVTRAWHKKGKSLAAMGQFEEAFACFDRALEISPKDEIVWTNLAIVFKAAGKRTEAIRCYDQAISFKPGYRDAWIGKGEVLIGSGDFEQGLGCLDVALSSNADDVATLNMKAVTLCRLNKQEEAIQIFDAILAKQPAETAVVLTNKGNAFLEMNKSEQALSCFDHALELDPAYVQAWGRRAAVMELLGDPTETIKCYSRALELRPETLDYWFGKGAALLLLGRDDEALFCFDKCLAVEPSNTKALYNKGVALIRMKDCLADALLCFQLATEHDPSYVNAWHMKGHCEKILGYPIDAVKSFNTSTVRLT